MMGKKSMENIDYFETVCINCPGSLWGEKSICRIHNKSIGEITSCEQWTRQPLKLQEDQLMFTDLEPAIEIVQKTEEDLRSYHWMVKEIERLSNKLDKAIRSSGPSENLVAQWGVEAIMPKGKGQKIAEMSISDERYERQWQRLEKLRGKVQKIERAVENITNEKERTVLECILDGERMNMIARHVGISRQYLNGIKRLLVKKVAWELYEEELRK
jgi:hypothetical protein